MKRFKKLSIIMLIMAFAVTGNMPVAADGNSVAEFTESIIEYNLDKVAVSTVQEWIDTELCETAGEGAEWYIIGLSKYGEYDFSKYEKALISYLDNVDVGSAASRQKYALTLMAVGSNDLFISETANNSIGKQGIMSLIFGLHLLNNGCVSKKYSKEKLAQEILSLQCDDGGWSLMGTAGDVDITAMAIQALAPRYSDNSVRASVDKALKFLSDRQESNGGYSSYGVNNPESSAQVLTALSALGIDAATDDRFAKDGNTVFDAIDGFQLSDGSFCHNSGGTSNGTATVQVFYSMVAYSCMKNLYLFDNVGVTDFSEERQPTTAVYASPNEEAATTESEKQTEEKTTSKQKTTVKSTTSVITAYSVTDKRTSVTEVTTVKELQSTIKTETIEKVTTSVVTEEICTNVMDVTETGAVTEPKQTEPESEKGTSYTENTEESVTATARKSDKRLNVRLIVILSIIIAALSVCIIIFLKGKGRTKNILFVLVTAAVVIAFVAITDFQSTDSYYESVDYGENSIGTVIMTIRCDNIKDVGEEHIPSDGVILEATAFDISDGDTVYDILQKASSMYRIHIETSKSGDSVYVEGIGNIYEMQFGDLSGWMYFVNGESPSVGCGEYVLSTGDIIEWHYTCDLGRDIAVGSH